uniref:Endonuclease/exonuclease/phosphatase domain-containing protein n=1 Tax=Aegilops tauschii subsp. strangulata TaxID=200361 RepID=A0A453JE43_AEGTS
MTDSTDWLVVGDFNFMRYSDNRNRAGGNVQDMLSFNDAIRAQALVEIPLKGRNFTWSNMQQAPLLDKLDWAFSSESWTLQYPNTLAIPLAKPISDHCPCVFKVGTAIPKSTIFRF